MIKFSHGCTIEKMFLKKSKISQILPTCNPLLEKKTFVDVTYGVDMDEMSVFLSQKVEIS